MLKRSNLILLVALVLNLIVFNDTKAEDSQFFAQTNYTVSGKFLEYWRNNGGLATHGYPISEAQNEVDPQTGKTFLGQWFERSRLELRPENGEVLSGLLGKELNQAILAKDSYFLPAEIINEKDFFKETGHNLDAKLASYWRDNGGLARFGYPISEVYQTGIDPETGKTFRMQWFERARLEIHPENPAPYNILLGLLGKQLKKRIAATPLERIWEKKAATNYLKENYSEIAVDTSGNIYNVGLYTAIIQKRDKNGTFLLQWQAEGSNIVAMTLDKNGNVYTLDDQARVLQKFDSNGKVLLTWRISEDKLYYPTALAIDNDDNIYIADAGTDYSVQKFDNSGKLLLKWKVTNPEYLAIDRQNNVYVANSAELQKYTSQGQLSTELRFTQGKADGEFDRISPIALDPQGNLLIGDFYNHRIQKIDSNGKFLSKIEVADDASGTGFSDFATDVQGNLYVTSPNKLYIKKLDNVGKLLSLLAATTPDDINCAGSLMVDNQNNLYVQDTKFGRILKLNSNDGQLIANWNDAEAGSNTLTQTNLLAIDNQNNLYTYKDSSIKKFDNSGHLLSSLTIKDDSISNIKRDSQGNYYVVTYDGIKGYHVYLGRFDKEGRLLNTKTSTGRNTFAQMVVDKNDDTLLVINNAQIERYNSNWQLINQWGSNGREDAQFSGASSLEVDKQGNVYVTDDVNERTQKFDKQGKFLTKLTPGLFKLTIDQQGYAYAITDCGISKYRLP